MKPGINTFATVPKSPSSSGRREFIGRAAAMALGIAGSATFSGKPGLAQGPNPPFDQNQASGRVRQMLAWQARVESARLERDRPVAEHPNNGDEARYPNKIASYSKGLPHNLLGEVNLAAWNSLVRALNSEEPADFESVLTSGNSRLVNPQAGLAFALEGPDSHALSMKPAPAFSSAEQAGEIGENYWMALARDVSFSDYSSHPLTQQAASDLSRFTDFRGPSDSGRITPSTLFRGVSQGDLTGPYISQAGGIGRGHS